MDAQDMKQRSAAARRVPAGTGSQTKPESYHVRLDYPPSQAPRPASRKSPATGAVLARRSRQALTAPGEPLAPIKDTRSQRRRTCWIREHRTWAQRVGGLLITGLLAVSAAWYVPRVMSSDRRVLTGTVTTTGIIALNFVQSGEINKMNVRLGQTVHKGQVLATEYAPGLDAVAAAQKAVIVADEGKIAQLRAAEAADLVIPDIADAQLAADKAQLALDEAELASDRAKVASTEIVAPSSGTVVAANGQAGEVVTPSGIRDYLVDSPQPPAAQGPQFSLLPEGPQSTPRTATSESALPVIALRTSNAWQVVALLPQVSASAIASGQAVTISVPAANISDVHGTIDAVLPSPIASSQGSVYQAVVRITGRARKLPLTGMAADIQPDH